MSLQFSVGPLITEGTENKLSQHINSFLYLLYIYLFSTESSTFKPVVQYIGTTILTTTSTRTTTTYSSNFKPANTTQTTTKATSSQRSAKMSICSAYSTVSWAASYASSTTVLASPKCFTASYWHCTTDSRARLQSQ